MHVLLFDIDGTLIDTCGSGLMALQLAFGDLLGLPAPAAIDTCGRTDRGIVRQLFLDHGVPESPETWQRFLRLYSGHLAAHLPRRNGRVLPGVADLLQALALRSDIAVGLLTGNTPEGARIKLQHFGLDHHFPFGGFGEDHPERAAVAEAALAAARQQVNHQVVLDRVWVVGDTPHDIACARHIGARAVAVATGLHQRASLARQQPDLLLDSLEQVQPLLSLLETGVAG